MSSRGTWIEGNTIHLDDSHGWPTVIPARVAHLMLETAKQSDEARAKWSLRWFTRDVLQGAVDLLDQRDQCTFTSAAGDCDTAAVFDLADARPRCASHHKEA